MQNEVKEREKFGSRLGFILVSAGCAVGLGNVWKFPYICGENGGAAFVLIYLVFLAMLGFPILCAEFAIGRGSGKGAARAFEVLESKGSKWHYFKWVSVVGSYILMAFYTMVAGWMLYYAWLEASGKMAGLDSEKVSAKFASMLGNPGNMTIWTIVAVVLSFGVCALGLQNGIEKGNDVTAYNTYYRIGGTLRCTSKCVKRNKILYGSKSRYNKIQRTRTGHI